MCLLHLEYGSLKYGSLWHDMTAPFGFSVGDFIAGINIIITSIKAVQNGRGSSAQFQALTSELKSLRSGLSAIQDLKLDQTAHKEYAAIREAAVDCQLCVEDFIRKVSKYQTWLQPGVDGWKANFRKIQWAFCDKKDVADFRDQLVQRSSTINLLMVSLQVRQGLEHNKTQKMCQATAQETLDTTVETQVIVSRSNGILQGLSEQQGILFQQMVQQIEQLAECNRSLVKEVVQLQNMMQLQHEIPAQVLLQKPVLLLDACGRMAPFHLEFINSKEAFLAVLKVRFQQCGVTPKGLRKIDRFEFILCDR